MLPPETRSILLDALRPPVGHRLAGAIATTFTLDLTAAVIPPLAFSSFEISSPAPDPVTALEAVRAAADKVDIFCQGGNIAIPTRAPDLLAFVEPMVHAVRRPAGHLFHPKVWFVHYVDGDAGDAFRLLVLTRNLTSDRTWDIVVRLDSQGRSRVPLDTGRDLQDLLASLPGRSITPLTTVRRERVERLADAARYVVWERPEGVEGLSLHYLDGRKRLDVDGPRHLVISPFVTDDGLDLIAGRAADLTLISRPEELERLKPERLGRTSAHIIDPMASLAADDEGDADVARGSEAGGASDGSRVRSLLTGLHAKLIVIELHGRAQRARVLIGSANATGAALTGNVEFMVALDGPQRLFGVDAFMDVLRPIVAPYSATGGAPPDVDESERRDLENRLRCVAEIQHILTVVPRVGEPVGPIRHDLVLSTDRAYPVGDGWAASVEVMTCPGVARHPVPGAPIADRFERVETADISPFLCVRLTSPSGLQGGSIVLASLVGDPSDRLDLVLARQIDTPEKFLRFLVLILSLGDSRLLAEVPDGSGGGGRFGLDAGGPGVLELVLRALAVNPAALDDLGRLVERLTATPEGRMLLPDGFERLWAQADDARRRLATDRS